LYYDANITFRILVKIIQGYGVGALELGILPGAGDQIKNHKDPELSYNLGPDPGLWPFERQFRVPS